MMETNLLVDLDSAEECPSLLIAETQVQFPVLAWTRVMVTHPMPVVFSAHSIFLCHVWPPNDKICAFEIAFMFPELSV